VLLRVFAAFAAIFCVSSASASTIVGFNGTFTSDDDQVRFRFVVENPLSTVSIFTTSFSGAGGGFIPVLSIFSESTGEALSIDSGFANNTNAVLQDWPTDPDATYIVVLTEYDNLPLNGVGGLLTDGFTEDGAGNFTSSLTGIPGPFSDSVYGHLTGDWAVTFSSLDPTLSAEMPEPNAALLAGPGMLLLLWLRRKRAARN
jgi:hypothetical protein